MSNGDGERASSDDDVVRDSARLRFLAAASEHPKIRLADKLNCQQDQVERLLKQYRLYYDWVLHEARLACLTSQTPRSPGPGCPKFHPPSHVVDEGPEIRVSSFWPVFESEKNYRKRMKRKFGILLNRRTREVRKRRQPIWDDRGAQLDHYRWAVERVCLGWSYVEIAKRDCRRSPQAIAKAVRKVLDRIGVPRKQT